MKFKVGDRARCYDAGGTMDGEITEIIENDQTIWVKESHGYSQRFHIKQCRKLKPKQVKQKNEDMTFWEAIEYLKISAENSVTCYDNGVKFYLGKNVSLKSGWYSILRLKLSNEEYYEWRPTSKEILEMKYWVVE